MAGRTAHCHHPYHRSVEVDHGRAARAGAEDTSEAEHRVATRRRRHRFVALGVAVALLLGGLALAVDRVWFGAPSLAAGTHHAATLQTVPGGCPGQHLVQVDFGGRVWWPEELPEGVSPPVRGTLVIIRLVDAHVMIDVGRTAQFLVDGHTIDLTGGGRQRAQLCVTP